MNVVVVTVTYGDRFHYLKQVIDAVLAQGINKIVVIDNGSHENSKNQLKNLEKELKDILLVTYLDRNYGSAGGFKRGIQEAEKLDKDFIYILDDDNIPEQNAIQILIDFWKNNKLDNPNSILASLRKNRNIYQQIIEKQDVSLFIGSKNNFMGFNLKNYIFKNNIFNKNIKIITEVNVAQYGGMFFNKILIKKIGYPNSDYFVYYDDYDFSFRVTKNNGKIYILLNSLVEDIDFSWHQKKETKSLMSTILKSDSSFRVYYHFRNKTYFDFKNRTSNKLLYFTNMFIYLSKLSAMSIINFKFKRLLLILIAIKDGLNGNLGEKNIDWSKF